jgi:hypothetical protein
MGPKTAVCRRIELLQNAQVLHATITVHTFVIIFKNYLAQHNLKLLYLNCLNILQNDIQASYCVNVPRASLGS